MIPKKGEKLLRLALDPAAAAGEWKNAAVMFVGSLRKAGATTEMILTPPAPSSSYNWQSPPRSTARMPFGKHKGERLSEIPEAYLHWLLTLPDLKTRLRWAVEAELELRS